MAQFGIHGNPEVHQKWNKRSFSDDVVRHTNSRGTITFATSGPNTRTTQLFINLVDNHYLDKEGFAPIGKVISGMNYVDAIFDGYGEG